MPVHEGPAFIDKYGVLQDKVPIRLTYRQSLSVLADSQSVTIAAKRQMVR
jgi:hypothetical protein